MWLGYAKGKKVRNLLLIGLPKRGALNFTCISVLLLLRVNYYNLLDKFSSAESRLQHHTEK